MKSTTHHRSRSNTAALAGHPGAAANPADPAFADSLRERLRAAIARPGSGEGLERLRSVLEER